MSHNYINIYNNLIKLTRNKNLYNKITNNDSFSDRLVIFLIHFAFFLKNYKSHNSKNDMQNIYDFIFRQIELSIREIGYGDASINAKMKKYLNLFHLILDKVDRWDQIPNSKKKDFLSNNLNFQSELDYLIKYIDKYIIYLSNNTLNYFSKDVISLEF
jgi:cytochrome b pre-mRNA-processing protein 3